ncbi:ketopantoate reductase family protein [Rhodoferax sp.]|uniref:ketopantoate reductase family protein n=1 Tax=Rhodoferax sp. TaxID=50421 RepID=UPI00374CF4E2
MKVAVMGAGGVGGYFGARLALSGCDVHFIARGAHGAAIRAHGLKVTSPFGDLHVANAQVTETPQGIGEVDVVLFGVKLWDTQSAAEAIRPLVGPNTAVISFQNGVVKDEILSAALGPQAVAGGVCYIAASIASPGVIAHVGQLQKLVFGEYDGRPSERLQRFQQACQAAGIDAEISPDIRKTIWEKFVFLVGLSAMTAVTRSSIGKVRAHPGSRRVLQQIIEEAVAVGRAQGVPLAADFAADRMRFCDGLPEAMISSMAHDLERGNRLEVHWLSGDVARRGAALGVPTPANAFVHDVLALHAEGRKS